MFGGLAFLVNGNLALSVSGRGGLLLRVDPAGSESLLRAPGVAPFVMRGREMDGWLHVAPTAVDTDAELARWARLGLARAASLPAK
jgi:hypothetical protein